MTDITKYAPININGGTLISDFKTHFSVLRTKRTVAVAYAFVFLFIAFTIFFAFCPSSNSSSPWFTDIFTLTGTGAANNNTTSIASSDQPYGSHFSSILSYFFPNSSSPQSSHAGSVKNNAPRKGPIPVVQNQTKNQDTHHQVEAFKPNNASTVVKKKPDLTAVNNNATQPPPTRASSEKNAIQSKQLQSNNSESSKQAEALKTNHSTISNYSPTYASELNNATANGHKEVAEKNLTSSLMKGHNNGTDAVQVNHHGGVDYLVKSLKNCDLFDGNWVRDESYPLYKPGSCPLIDEQFNCFLNGRPDNGYLKLKWKPKGCTLPRLEGSRMLEMLRGKRLVFVGDSLNRNMWESLICILRNSVRDQKKVYEEFGRHHFRTEASYSFVFEDYKCTIEFFASPFLVQEWEATDKNGTKMETLRLDLIGMTADKYKNADIIVFNTGHWWTHDKTSLGKDYYQEGSHVYSELNVLEAFRKALTTWGRWVDANVNPMKSLTFFRGYSASHFSGGQWNSGGQCDHETEPIRNETYLSEYPSKMTVLERVLRGMKTRVTYLNVTRMTDYRKDGHPSIYRKQHLSDEERKSASSIQDCSHWCLPGVPDAWNEILYAELLVKLNEKQQKKP